MYRDKYFSMMNDPEMLDYGVYLNCDKLLSSQKPFDELCNGDELQFQIVHQVEELWMKQMIYTLVDVLECLQSQNSHKVLTLFRRVHIYQNLMIDQLAALETMSPKDYQQIRLQLGNGSGQESPGFRTLLKMPKDLWTEFKQYYLVGPQKSLKQIYDDEFAHDQAYLIAEAMLEFDELMQKFRWHHIFLINRSIGMTAKSLKGRAVELLQKGASQQFFPELWEVRATMTDAWGSEYGQVRESISNG